MNNQFISIEHLYKTFQKTTVLEDINLSFEKGKIYGFVGHNGSGKTVLFKCICGFIPATQGKIIVNGKILGSDIDVLPNAGIIIEQPAFLAGISGIRNLEMLYMLNNKVDKQVLRDAMKRVGLDPASKKPVGKYSLGMRQRLAIAQAFMESPDILVLDEPMNGLDKNGVNEMRILFQQLKSEGRTILMASHNKEDIDLLCDEVYEMENGRIIRKINND